VALELPRELAAQRSVVSLVRHEGEPSDRALHDGLIGRLFGCGLEVSAVLSDDGVDDRAAERLRDVIDNLDVAIREIRDFVVTRLGVNTP
jgi:hypothetical protein